MYRLSKSAFGQFEKFTLENTLLSAKIDFVPSRGACLLGIEFEGVQLLDAYQTAEELDFNTWGKSGLLYPFPNRLKDGRFSWEGIDYQFPINDTGTGNALHGFGMERKLEIVDHELSEDTAWVKMEGHYDGSYAHYPWSFTFGVTYKLSANNAFEVDFYLKNTSDKRIPIGIGWHPYFQLGEKIDDHSLQLPQVDMVGVDQRMIPTGKRYEYDEFEEEKQINATVLDNCFELKEQQSTASVILKGAKGQIRYWQETGEGKFNYLQVFTPPYRSSVALEPMTCNVDAFNNKDGLIVLSPSEEFSAKAGVLFLK